MWENTQPGITDPGSATIFQTDSSLWTTMPFQGSEIKAAGNITPVPSAGAVQHQEAQCISWKAAADITRPPGVRRSLPMRRR